MSNQQPAALPTIDEKQLAKAIKNGDETAFDQLFRTWYEPLVRYAFSFTDGDADEAEDIVQQVFVQFWQRRETIDFQHSVKAYLYKMTHNRALNRLRSQKVQGRFVEHQTRQIAHETEPPPGVGELEKRFHEVLGELPPQCRQVFELSRFEELKYREIGDQLGISVKTVETHISKALRILRRELVEFLSAILLIINVLG